VVRGECLELEVRSRCSHATAMVGKDGLAMRMSIHIAHFVLPGILFAAHRNRAYPSVCYSCEFGPASFYSIM
jgi:hypothetical protein